MFYGEYIWTGLPDDRGEIKNIRTGERWILEEEHEWVCGPYFKHGNRVFSFRNPELMIRLSAKMTVHWRVWMLGKRAVYVNGDDATVRDAITDETLFAADYIWGCDAGLVFDIGGKLHFADGVHDNIQLDEIGANEAVWILRVSETEYSIKVGADRYFLLDAEKLSCSKFKVSLQNVW